MVKKYIVALSVALMISGCAGKQSPLRHSDNYSSEAEEDAHVALIAIGVVGLSALMVIVLSTFVSDGELFEEHKVIDLHNHN